MGPDSKLPARYLVIVLLRSSKTYGPPALGGPRLAFLLFSSVKFVLAESGFCLMAETPEVGVFAKCCLLGISGPRNNLCL